MELRQPKSSPPPILTNLVQQMQNLRSIRNQATKSYYAHKIASSEQPELRSVSPTAAGAAATKPKVKTKTSSSTTTTSPSATVRQPQLQPQPQPQPQSQQQEPQQRAASREGGEQEKRGAAAIRPDIRPNNSEATAPPAAQAIDRDQLYRRYKATVKLLAESLEEQGNLRALVELTSDPSVYDPILQAEIFHLANTDFDELPSRQGQQQVSPELVQKMKYRAMWLEQEQLATQVIELRTTIEQARAKQRDLETELEMTKDLLQSAQKDISRLEKENESLRQGALSRSSRGLFSSSAPPGTPPSGKSHSRMWTDRERLGSALPKGLPSDFVPPLPPEDAVLEEELAALRPASSSSASSNGPSKAVARVQPRLGAHTVYSSSDEDDNVLDELDQDDSVDGASSRTSTSGNTDELDVDLDSLDELLSPKKAPNSSPRPKPAAAAQSEKEVSQEIEEAVEEGEEEAEEAPSLLQNIMYNLTIELSDTEKDDIQITHSSEPMMLAFAFIEKHKLSANYFEPLYTKIEYIKSELQQIEEQSLLEHLRSQSDEDGDEAEDSRSPHSPPPPPPLGLENGLGGEQGGLAVGVIAIRSTTSSPLLMESIMEAKYRGAAQGEELADDVLQAASLDEYEADEGTVEDMALEDLENAEQEEEEEPEDDREDDAEQLESGPFYVDVDLGGGLGSQQHDPWRPSVGGAGLQQFGNEGVVGEEQYEEEAALAAASEPNVDRQQQQHTMTVQQAEFPARRSQPASVSRASSDPAFLAENPAWGRYFNSMVSSPFADPRHEPSSRDSATGRAKAEAGSTEKSRQAEDDRDVERLMAELDAGEDGPYEYSDYDDEGAARAFNFSSDVMKTSGNDHAPGSRVGTEPDGPPSDRSHRWDHLEADYSAPGQRGHDLLSDLATPIAVEPVVVDLSPQADSRQQKARAKSPSSTGKFSPISSQTSFPADKSINHEEIGEIIDVAHDVLHRADALLEDGRLDQAVPLYQSAIRLLELTESEDSNEVRDSVADLLL